MPRKVTHLALIAIMLLLTLPIAQAQNRRLPVPRSLAVNGATLSWNAVTNASGYQVHYRANNEGRRRTFSVMPGQTRYTFTGLDFDVPYTVGVRALAASVPGYRNSDWADAADTILLIKPTPTATATAARRLKLPAPANFKKTSEYAVSWDSVPAALRYELVIIGKHSKREIPVAASQTAFTFVHLTDGQTYFARVRAIGNRRTHKRDGNFSAYVQLRPGSGVTVALPAPSGLLCKAQQVCFDAVEHADEYQLFRPAASQFYSSAETSSQPSGSSSDDKCLDVPEGMKVGDIVHAVAYPAASDNTRTQSGLSDAFTLTSACFPDVQTAPTDTPTATDTATATATATATNTPTTAPPAALLTRPPATTRGRKAV